MTTTTTFLPRLLLLLTSLLNGHLIWGISILNGLTTLCSLASEQKHFPTSGGEDGPPTALRTVWTGLPPLDFMITTNVTFFHGMVRDAEGRWALANGFQLVFAVMACQLVEAGRAYSRRRGGGVTRPGTWNLAGQVLGVGLINPFYYYQHLYHDSSPASPASTSPSDRYPSFSIPAPAALAIVPSIFLGAVLPFTLLFRYAPEMHPEGPYQVWLALIQPWALYVGVFHAVFSAVFGLVCGRKEEEVGDGKGKGQVPEAMALRFTYAVMLAFSAGVHNVARFLHTEALPPMATADKIAEATAFTVRSLYLPSLQRVEALGDVVKVFMRNDLVVLGVGALVWGGVVLAREVRSGGGGGGDGKAAWMVAGGMVLAGAVVGPGAACVAAFWAREEILFKRRRVMAGSGSGKKAL